MINSASFLSSIFQALVKISDAYDLDCPDSLVQDKLRSSVVNLLDTIDYFKDGVRKSFDLV